MITIAREVLYRTLRAVAPFASKDATRYHICGVCLEIDGASLHAVATDGWTLAHAQPLCRAAGASDRGAVLPTETVETLVRALKPSKANAHQELVLSIAETGEVLVTGWLGAPAPMAPVRDDKGAPAQFPPWRAVVPPHDAAEKQAGAFALHPRFLARAGDAAKRFGVEADSARGRIRTPERDLDPVRLDVSDVDTGDLTVVIMPMRMS